MQSQVMARTPAICFGSPISKCEFFLEKKKEAATNTTMTSSAHVFKLEEARVDGNGRYRSFAIWVLSLVRDLASLGNTVKRETFSRFLSNMLSRYFFSSFFLVLFSVRTRRSDRRTRMRSAENPMQDIRFYIYIYNLRFMLIPIFAYLSSSPCEVKRKNKRGGEEKKGRDIKKTLMSS